MSASDSGGTGCVFGCCSLRSGMEEEDSGEIHKGTVSIPGATRALALDLSKSPDFKYPPALWMHHGLSVYCADSHAGSHLSGDLYGEMSGAAYGISADICRNWDCSYTFPDSSRDVYVF